MAQREAGKGSTTPEDWYRLAAGTVLRRLREARNWSFRDFGEQVNAAHTTLYAVERGDATPGIDVLDRVAEACGLSLPALLFMIVDELRVARTHAAASSPAHATGGASLADVAEGVADLTPRQRAELLEFAAFLRFRDRE